MNNKELGYKTAIDLMIYEGELVWTRFNTILTAHLVLFGILGFVISNKGITIENSPYLIVLSIAGVLISISWFVMTSRGFAFVKYYTLSARESEDQIDSNDLVILRRGYKFSKNEFVYFDKIKQTDKELRSYQREWYTKLFGSLKTELAAYMTIIVIFFIYILMLIVAAHTLLCNTNYTNFYYLLY